MGKQSYSKREKLAILKEGEKEGIKKVSERYGVHFTTVYDWRKKYFQGGEHEVPSRSGGHNKGEREIEVWKKEAVVREKESNPGYGVSQIRNQLRRQGVTISTLTIGRILREQGYSVKKEKSDKKAIRFEASRPLELVQIDIMEFYIHKARLYLVLLLDDYSRFLLNFHLTDGYSIEGIQGMVEEAIQRYGKMEKLLSDRGFVFHGWRGVNRFEKCLEAQGIHHIHTSVHHPQTIGKVERVNQSLQKELLRVKEFSCIGEAFGEIDQWLWRYNYKRVHQGLGGLEVPADRFHGWSREMDKALGKLLEDGPTMEGRELSLFTIKLVDGKLQFMIMGKEVGVGYG